MNVNEDCYAVGHFSKMIASELANMPQARGRRKVEFITSRVVWMPR